MNLTDQIRTLLKTHGPLTALELRALLPDRKNPDGTPRRVRAREVHSRLHAACQPNRDCTLPALLQKLPGDRYQWLRDPAVSRCVKVYTCPEERAAAAAASRRRYEEKRLAQRREERRARGLKPLTERAFKIKREADYSTRQDNAAKAQAISRRQLGLRDMPPPVAFESVDEWMARTGQQPQQLRPGECSPAGQFRKLVNA